MTNGNFVEEHKWVRHADLEGAIAFLGGTSQTELRGLLPKLLNYDEIPMFGGTLFRLLTGTPTGNVVQIQKSFTLAKC